MPARSERYVGPWADTHEAAIREAASDVKVDDWMRLDFSEGARFVDPEDRWQVDVDVAYSESRDQYRATLTRSPLAPVEG